jgi:hypothetical protein
VQQVVSINPEIKPDAVAAGQTILLPAGQLSSRDREILEGIGHVYRVYPVRKGESYADITAKRAITRPEMEALNPGVNLDRLKGAFARARARWSSSLAVVVVVVVAAVVVCFFLRLFLGGPPHQTKQKL